jgi:hypothetical protein
MSGDVLRQKARSKICGKLGVLTLVPNLRADGWYTFPARCPEILVSPIHGLIALTEWWFGLGRRSCGQGRRGRSRRGSDGCGRCTFAALRSR